MKILVTGGGGFLGRYICRDLKKLGHEVYSFSRNHYDHLDEIDVKTIKGSIRSKDDIMKALDGIDAVFHTAAIAGVWGKKEDFYETNYYGTQKLVDACLEKKIKYFINTSSPSVVFEKDDIEGADETIEYPENYLTDYAKTKALSEKYVLSKCSNEFFSVSLRPHLIFGKEDPHLVPTIVKAAKKGSLKIVGNADNLVDVIYVENASDAHVKAFAKLIKDHSISGKAYFIGQEAPVNLWDFVNDILHKKKLDPIVDRVSFKKAYYAGFVFEKIYKLLGIYSPIPPMTRFVACQLGKSHYFTHQKAKDDFGYEIKFSTKKALEMIAHTKIDDEVSTSKA